MTNDIFCVGLTRTELQTLGVLLPITFQIIPVSSEALDHTFDEPKQWEIREIMNQCVNGWTYFSNPCSFCGYGRQKGWERERAATGSDNSAAEIPDGFVEITEQIEMPF